MSLSATDLRLVALVAARDADLRSGLSTLARLGVQLRRAEPDRAEKLVQTFEPHPFYKAGQTLFDLWEFEDFLLDGKPAPADPAALQAVLSRLGAMLGFPIGAIPDLSGLPPLEAGFYLYRDVVLGLLSILSAMAGQLPEGIA